ncbi:MAG: metalloregulator ArsR/SmtB family transcription factor [Hydrogenothermaceae bacterium]|nr:metalloregulator ArsR/SmtB family transcription factor [Hydrogenothermaceae bacterium]
MTSKRLDKFFYALSDETRLKIVRILLYYPEVCVCQFQDIFNTSQPKVSFHLRVLKEAGIIKGVKVGKWTYYSLDRLPDCIEVLLREIPIEEVNTSCEVGDEKS